MGVFEPAGYLCDAARAAARELGLFAALAGRAQEPAELAELAELADAIGVPGGHRLRALLDVLAALGALTRSAGRFAVPPPLPVVTAEDSGPPPIRAGWGLLADVIRLDRPLALEAADEERYHRHLLEAGAAAARELAPLLGAANRGALADLSNGAAADRGGLLDLGGGAGAYTAAFLDAHAGARATLVDVPATVALAERHLARFGERVQFIRGDARTAPVGAGYAVALLANVLHLHPVAVCADLCAAAARAVAPGGLVAVVDLRVDEDRGGPLTGLLFALNMAVYTEGGDVHAVSRIRAWLADAGLIEIEARPLASAPEAMVVLGRRPPVRAEVVSDSEAEVARELEAALVAARDTAWQELERTGELLDAVRAAGPPRLWFPAALARTLARAVAHERAEGSAPAADRAAALIRHYTQLMPRARVALLASRAEPAATLFHTQLDWAHLPRLGAAIDRIYALVEDAGADPSAALGAPSASALRARTPTLAALYERTCYGGLMPLLYGGDADLAYFRARADADGLDVHGAIDRYLAAPMVHELCHFGPTSAALEPLHLDECVAGWLGVHVHPELAYPAPGHDDAIFAAPWLSQIGQAIARAFGVRAVVRAHASAAPVATALPAPFVAAAARLGWDDWLARRTLHFLSDTLDPAPWAHLALAAGAGLPLGDHTLSSLACLPPAAFAALPADPAFDLAIVADGLRAMCLESARIDGSFRTRTQLPGAPITVDAETGWLFAARPSELLGVAPRYWLPPAVSARLAAAGHARYELSLGSLGALPEAAAALCAAAPSVDRDSFALRPLTATG
ncbi:MAG TPA: methyltransferase [Kofleriaceae bacterium]|nr:methyltransferase [Kofleriaceae bacterium]